MVYYGGKAMSSESERLKTFENWPAQVSYIKTEDLAKAGFFHNVINANESDCVKCAFCGISLRLWEKGEQPLKKHRKMSPTCPFILSMDVGNKPIIAADGQIPTMRNCDNQGQRLYLPLPMLPSHHGGVISMRCHFQFLNYKNRMSSFSATSVECQTAKQLARSGFYCKDNGTIKCYKCHFESSIINHRAVIDHEVSIPRCPFLNNRRIMSHVSVALDNGSNCVSNISLEEARVRLDSWLVDQAINLDLDCELVKCVALEQDTFDGHSSACLPGFVDEVLHRMDAIIEQLPAVDPENDQSTALLQWRTFVDRKETLHRDQMENRKKELEERINQNPDFMKNYLVKENIIAANDDLNDLDCQIRIQEALKKLNFCIQCGINPANIVFRPCNHLVLCQLCNKGPRFCCQCGGRIDQITRVKLF